MKAFCEECRDDVEYQVFVEQTTTSVHGKTYTFTSQTPRCKRCGNYVYVPDIIDSNLEVLYQKVNEQNEQM